MFSLLVWYNKGEEVTTQYKFERDIEMTNKKETRGAKAPRVKRLNIYNTDRHYNFNLAMRSDIESKIKVTRLNEQEIEAEMDMLRDSSGVLLKRNNKEYIIYQEKYKNDRLIQKLMAHAGGVSYYTNTIVPYHILKELAKNLNGECIYALKKKYTLEEIYNINLAFMATRVVIDVPVVLPNLNPYDVLFSLFDLKTDVDNVQFSFPPLRDYELGERNKHFYELKEDGLYYMKDRYRFSFFKYVQTSMSIWNMNIVLICESEKMFDTLESKVVKDRKKSATKRKGEFKNG